MKILSIDRVLSATGLNIDLAQIKTTTGKVIERFVIDPVYNSVVAVVRRNGKLIFVKTKRLLRDSKCWELPGGIVNHGEIALAAIRRKVEEETGFEVTKIARLGSSFSDFGISKNEKFYFLVDVGNRIKDFNRDLIEEVALFNPKQVTNLINGDKIKDDRSLTGLMLAKNKGYL